MAAQLAADDPDTTRFEATVRAVDDTAVRLERTYFYAASGGQPADRGTIDGIPVADVTRADDGIVHELAEPPAFAPGERVQGEIDPGFRTYCRRAHTASHVLYGAARDHLAELGYGGFDIGERKVRIDFRTTTEVDDDRLLALERLANRTVWESRPVTWETHPPETVADDPAVAFNTKTEEGVFAAGEDVRVVEIGPPAHADGSWLDRAACGGTHVRNTREIGPIAVLDRSNPGEGLVRIELAVGETAIDHRAELARAAHDAARSLGVGIEELPRRVGELRSDLESAEAERRTAVDRAIRAQLTATEPTERNGETWLLASVSGADADALTRHAREQLTDGRSGVLLVTEERPLQLAVAAGDGVDAGAVVGEITGTFGGGGGGGPDIAQGGGIDAAPAAVIDALAE